jgi:hypothetical protein
LEEELEATLNFLRRTIIYITKLTPHVIVISNSKEVEIEPQPVIEEQLQLVSASKLVEEEEFATTCCGGTTTTSSCIKTYGKKQVATTYE